MKKILKITCLVILLILLIFLIYRLWIYDYLFFSSVINTHIPLFSKMEEYDTHGGFHGDGINSTKFYLSNNQASLFTKNISKNIYWKNITLPKNLEYIIYNNIDKNISSAISNEYIWMFIDRKSSSGYMYDYNNYTNDYSSNFSVAVYNITSKIIYIYSLDT